MKLHVEPTPDSVVSSLEVEQKGGWLYRPESRRAAPSRAPSGEQGARWYQESSDQEAHRVPPGLSPVS